MNRIIASVGLVALGATSVQAQSSISAPPAKWWNVQATVRGFYDDNLNTSPNPTHNDRVWGYELSPKVGIAAGNDQTSFTADYRYAFLYYDNKPVGDSKKFDQDHTFNATLRHAFNERYSVRLRDSFVVGQEPDALRAGAFHTPFRVSGENIVNYGGIAFDAELTPLLGLEVGYDNAWFDYSEEGLKVGRNLTPPDGGGTSLIITPSTSGVLDRVEQTAHLSALWHVMPNTTASLTYQYGQINYTGDEHIAGLKGGNPPRDTFLTSSDRNNRSHTVFVGLDHQFRPDFYGSVQAGASYYDYYNLDSTSFGPYARLALTYVYAPESSLQAGFQQSRAATDVFGSGTNKTDLVRDAETSVLFATIRQRIVPRLFANLNGSAQHASFNGGGSEFDNKSEDFYELGANLEYQFNAHFSAHAGYDFDRLDSDIANRSYKRNKVYIGATASY